MKSIGTPTMVKRTFALKNADRFEWGDRQPVEGRQEAVTDIKITFVDPKERQARNIYKSLGYRPPAPKVFIPQSMRAAALPRPASPSALAPKPIMHQHSNRTTRWGPIRAAPRSRNAHHW
jgi:hypothetical protein